ncbi:MAG: ThuA domain-containing protein [Firmicutes bacterium]|nr:ThuA domain-containing protein [Bacillota bacterium]
MNKIKLTIWNESSNHKKSAEIVKSMFPKEYHELVINMLTEANKIYPKGIHGAIADLFKDEADIKVKISLLDDETQGLSDKILDDTDVLIWWGHFFHDFVLDEHAERVAAHVQKGMGIIFLHSAHHSKPFKRLLGTSGSLKWREKNEKERVWVASPRHPIAEGLGEYFELEQEEMYGEPFGIPKPDDTIFISWFKGGNVFRSGVTFNREYGKIFYFQPGHETNKSFYDKNIKQVLNNAVRWAKPIKRMDKLDSSYSQEFESLE